MKLIAIDPGITKSGIVIGSIDNFNYDVQVVGWRDRINNWWETFDSICGFIAQYIEDYTECKFAIEEPVNYYRGGNKIVRQALFTGAILGVIKGINNFGDIETAVRENVKAIYLVNPQTAKLALTGKGNAKKDMMVKVATINYPGIRWNDFSKSSKETIADAIGIGLAVTKKLNGVTRLE